MMVDVSSGKEKESILEGQVNRERVIASQDCCMQGMSHCGRCRDE